MTIVGAAAAVPSARGAGGDANAQGLRRAPSATQLSPRQVAAARAYHEAVTRASLVLPLALAFALAPLASSAGDESVASSPRADAAEVSIDTTDAMMRGTWGRSADPWVSDGRTTIHRGAGKLAIEAGRRLVELRFGTRREAPGDRLLLDLRPGHHYRVHPDPCCFVAIEDFDSDLRPERRRRPTCVEAGGECPEGMVSVPSWIARDERCKFEQHTCVRRIQVRFAVSPAALRAGPLEVLVESDELADWTFTLDGDRVLVRRLDDRPAPVRGGVTAWDGWPWSRETSPASVIVRRAKAVLWERSVQLRLEHRYTIHIPDDAAAVEITRED
jgi:hypothetical protein